MCDFLLFKQIFLETANGVLKQRFFPIIFMFWKRTLERCSTVSNVA